MLLDYFKIALRGYLRNGTYTVLNLLSLILGLFVAYAGISYLRVETSYDSFHTQADRLYRVAWNYRAQGYSIVGFTGSADSGEEQLRQAEFIRSVPGVQEVVQFIVSPESVYLQSEEKKIQQGGILTTNTLGAFSSAFTWEPILGSLDNFSSGIQKVLLTEQIATKLYGADFATLDRLIGSTLRVGEKEYELAAVIRDVPVTSHFEFDLAISEDQIPYWGSRVYLLSDPGVEQSTLEDRIHSAFVSLNPRLATDPLYRGHFLQPIAAIHLSTPLLYESKPPGNRSYLKLIGFFTCFILAITLFNFSNLTLAIKSKERKTVGVRKVLGARNSGIATQFVIEGVGLALLALPGVALLASILIPFFNQLMGTAISDHLFGDPISAMSMLGIALLMGTLAGILPVLYLKETGNEGFFKSSVKPLSFEQIKTRKYLVISQYIPLLVIGSVSFFISEQLDFVRQKDLGYRKEGLMFAYSDPERSAFFQEKIRQIPGVLAVGNGSSFGIETYNQGTYKLEGLEEVFDDSNELYLDFEGLKAYELTTTLPDTVLSRVTLINRTAANRFAKLLGVSPEEVIGTTVISEPEYVNPETGVVGFPMTIGGIFEDIHLFSLKEELQPYFLTVVPELEQDAQSIIAFDPKQRAAVLQGLDDAHRQLNAATPLELEFLEDNLNQLYAQDRQTADLLRYLTVLAILLAGLGLVGITIFMVTARKKEIGIRKVLGASVSTLVSAATQEYAIWVGLALLASIPISYYFLQNWLASFAYRISVNPLVFLGVGGITLLGTALIVGSIAYRAAQTNPVSSLRSE